MVTLVPVSACFTLTFASKGVHGFKTLSEPERQHLHPNFRLI